MSNDSLEPLSYAGTDVRPLLPPAWKSGALRVAQVCWAIPFVAGTLIFIAALLTRTDRHVGNDLLYAGGWNILIGIGLSIVGGIAVLVFTAQRWAPAAGDRWSQIFRPAIGASLLLASNYGVAFVMICIVAP